MSFAEVGIEIIFKGKGKNEKAFITSCSNSTYQLKEGKEIVCIDERYHRPAEVDFLIGDATKAKRNLAGNLSIIFAALISEMVNADVELFRREKLLKEAGYTVKNQYE